MKPWKCLVDGKWFLSDEKVGEFAFTVEPKYTVDQLFEDGGDVDSYTDCITNAYEDINRKVPHIDRYWLRYHFDHLPDHIRVTALQWGLSDTCFRDEVYEHVTELLRIETTPSIRSLQDVAGVTNVHLVYGRYRAFDRVTGQRIEGIWMFDYVTDPEIARMLRKPTNWSDALPPEVRHEGRTLYLTHYHYNSVEQAMKEGEFSRGSASVKMGDKWWTEVDLSRHRITEN